MRTRHSLIIAVGFILILSALVACGSPGPGPTIATSIPVSPLPPIQVTVVSPINVTPAASAAPFVIPTVTATPQPTPLPGGWDGHAVPLSCQAKLVAFAHADPTRQNISHPLCPVGAPIDEVAFTKGS